MSTTNDAEKDPVQRVKDEFNSRVMPNTGLKFDFATYDELCFQIADARVLCEQLAELVQRVPFGEWARLGLDMERSAAIERFIERRCAVCGSYERDLRQWPCVDNPSDWHR